MPKVKDLYAVVLAGGSGERFWPMSTTKRPKQFLAIPSGKPLICAALERIERLIPASQIFIITRKDLTGLVHKVLPDFPGANIIGEPCGRDTAAAVAFGAALVKRQNPSAAFCVLTSDHLIKKEENFLKTLKSAFKLALSSNYLVTIGIQPSFPSTGYGYIETAGRLDGQTPFFKVRRFVEKPDLPTAKKYLRTGKYYWNSGMFIWSVPVLEAGFAKHCPQLTGLIRKITAVGRRPAIEKNLGREYAQLKKISIDYALMEKSDNIVMAKSNFPWDDVGSWAALEAHCGEDSNGNVIVGNGAAHDAQDNIAVAEDGMIALVGVRDLVVVRSGAATLVCAKGKAQDVKKLVARMKSGRKYKGIV